MPALIPGLAFIALETVTLIPRLPFIAEGSIPRAAGSDPLFQSFNLKF